MQLYVYYKGLEAVNLWLVTGLHMVTSPTVLGT
jgi:hypothetical protein